MALYGSRLSSFTQENVIFKENVNFSDAIFKGNFTLRTVTFEGNVIFDRCLFESQVDILNVHCNKSTSFYRAEFSGRTILRINFLGSATFNESIFREGVTFSGWRNININASGVSFSISAGEAILTVGGKHTILERLGIQAAKVRRWVRGQVRRLKTKMTTLNNEARKKINSLRMRYSRNDPDARHFTMFAGEGHLETVVFLKPDQTTFSEVDLSKVYFRGTNLRGVRFLGVTWWQPKLKRSGLYDEVFIRLSDSGPFKHRNLPALEETCRNARVSYEESRSFGVASDFYIAEMEAGRAQLGFFRAHFFSVPAIYRAVSNYGTNVGVAIRILVLIYVLHLVITLALSYPISDFSGLESLGKVMLHSFKVLLFQASESVPLPQQMALSAVDLIFRVLGLIQAAMIVFAFRSRIKRH